MKWRVRPDLFGLSTNPNHFSTHHDTLEALRMKQKHHSNEFNRKTTGGSADYKTQE